MPAPTASQLESPFKGLVTAQGLQGEHANRLATAFAELVAQAFSQCLSQVKVAPGIACTPAATAAPGRLL
jgi:hypothetical protein